MLSTYILSTFNHFFIRQLILGLYNRQLDMLEVGLLLGCLVLMHRVEISVLLHDKRNVILMVHYIETSGS